MLLLDFWLVRVTAVVHGNPDHATLLPDAPAGAHLDPIQADIPRLLRVPLLSTHQLPYSCSKLYALASGFLPLLAHVPCMLFPVGSGWLARLPPT